MNEARNLLSATAERLFGRLAAEPSASVDTGWQAVAATGVPMMLLPDASGGFGGDWQDVFVVLRLAGMHALSLPVGEAIVATWALSETGMTGADGIASIAMSCNGKVVGDRFSGELGGVPWGRHADTIVAKLDGQLIRLRKRDALVLPRESTAGEPRDRLTFTETPVEAVSSPIDLFRLGALLRTAQIAGGLDAALAMSITHANERVQFGRAIGKFQAVQQNLAVFAEEAAAANCASAAAFRAAVRQDASYEIAAAKVRANRAAEAGMAVAHQVHGAIGFTLEHPLNRITRRLVGWRSEFGNDRFWADRLGRQVAATGADRLWSDLVRRSDP